jgi:hypothetical protein
MADDVKRLAGYTFNSIGPDASCEITLEFEDLPSEKIASARRFRVKASARGVCRE